MGHAFQKDVSGGGIGRVTSMHPVQTSAPYYESMMSVAPRPPAALLHNKEASGSKSYVKNDDTMTVCLRFIQVYFILSLDPCIQYSENRIL